MLLKKGKRVSLLHTGEVGGTRSIADRLKIWFIQQGMAKENIALWEIDRTNRDNIHDKIEQIVSKDEKGVGLNYTSGTSAMSVHVHAAVSQRAYKPICSYLDGRNLCMVFDDGVTASVTS